MKEYCGVVGIYGHKNASQLAWLQAEGGEEAQGFYFSRPLPAKGMTALLKWRASA